MDSSSIENMTSNIEEEEEETTSPSLETTKTKESMMSDDDLFEALKKSNFKFSHGDLKLQLSLSSEGKIYATSEDQVNLVKPVDLLKMYEGVTWDEVRKIYSAKVLHRDALIWCEEFDTAEKAAHAYDEKMFHHFGMKCKQILNFGIPSKFTRCRENVVFIPGPDMWFVKFMLDQDSGLEIGYFKNVQAAETVYVFRVISSS